MTRYGAQLIFLVNVGLHNHCQKDFQGFILDCAKFFCKRDYMLSHAKIYRKSMNSTSSDKKELLLDSLISVCAKKNLSCAYCSTLRIFVIINALSKAKWLQTMKNGQKCNFLDNFGLQAFCPNEFFCCIGCHFHEISKNDISLSR